MGKSKLAPQEVCGVIFRVVLQYVQEFVACTVLYSRGNAVVSLGNHHTSAFFTSIPHAAHA